MDENGPRIGAIFVPHRERTKSLILEKRVSLKFWDKLKDIKAAKEGDSWDLATKSFGRGTCAAKWPEGGID